MARTLGERRLCTANLLLAACWLLTGKASIYRNPGYSGRESRMPRYYRLGSDGSNLQFTIPPGIQFLLITNGVIFVLFSFIPGAMRWFGLMPAMVVRGAIWQLLTYHLMHAG